MRKKKKNPETKDIYIDADPLLYIAAPAPAKGGLEGDTVEQEGPVSIKVHKKKVEDIVADYLATVQIESVFHDWEPGNVYLVFSDPDRNFRKDVDPGYKSSRLNKELPPAFYKLRKYLHKRHIVAKNCEADDVVAYYVRKGAIGISIDKDLLKGVPGMWYDLYHRTWVHTSKKEAKRFNLLQTLAGDPTDDIPGIEGVAIGTAEKLIGDDWSWERVVAIYTGKVESKEPPFYTKTGKISAVWKRIIDAKMTEEDAIRTRRLVCMRQWHPKKGIRLWEPK